MYKVLHGDVDNVGNITNNKSWAAGVKSLLNDLGFNFLWNNTNVTNIQIEKVSERIVDQYLQSWYSQIDTSSKLESYKLFKTAYESEKYLLAVNNISHRKSLTRFRCSAHKLAIEEGRFRNIDRNQRKCIHCNMNAIENEYHFLMVCPKYRSLRIDCLPRYYCSFPSKPKFVSLMKSEQSSILKRLAKFLFLANELRNEVG